LGYNDENLVVISQGRAAVRPERRRCVRLLRLMTTLAVLGPGGVGGFVAAALARAGELEELPGGACQEVVVVARPATAQLIARRGIRVHSAVLGDFEVRPTAVQSLGASEPVATLIVATKATGLRDALARVQCQPELVVPLLNGLDHMVLLRERFGAGCVAAAAIRIESYRPAPGIIKQTSPTVRIDLAAERQPARDRIAALADRLRSAGLPVQIQSSEAQVLWSKLARLCALALNTTASGMSIGRLRADPQARARLRACVHEAVAVATAEGARCSVEATMAELDAAHPQLGSSMQRDVAAGNEPELDAIAGAVLRAGDRHGIACPTISALAHQIASRTGAALRV
jgi:2-dehydropantoate 2-reductase